MTISTTSNIICGHFQSLSCGGIFYFSRNLWLFEDMNKSGFMTIFHLPAGQLAAVEIYLNKLVN